MVINSSYKKGFTLIEVLTSMLIMSIFFAAMSKAITTKHVKEKETQHHGYYECYLDGGKLYQRTVDDIKKEDFDDSKTSCEFTPPKGIPVATVYGIKRVSKYLILYKQTVIQLTETINIPRGDINNPDGYMVPEETSRIPELTDDEKEGKNEIEQKELLTTLKENYNNYIINVKNGAIPQSSKVYEYLNEYTDGANITPAYIPESNNVPPALLIYWGNIGEKI